MWIYAVFNRVLFDFFIQSVNLAGEVFFLWGKFTYV